MRSELQKISLRRRGGRLAARASHSAVAVDFPETSLCGGVQDCYELDRRMDRGARLRVNQGEAGGMPQSEVSGKSTATAECEARAARRLTRRRREIF